MPETQTLPPVTQVNSDTKPTTPFAEIIHPIPGATTETAEEIAERHARIEANLKKFSPTNPTLRPQETQPIRQVEVDDQTTGQQTGEAEEESKEEERADIELSDPTTEQRIIKKSRSGRNRMGPARKVLLTAAAVISALNPQLPAAGVQATFDAMRYTPPTPVAEHNPAPLENIPPEAKKFLEDVTKTLPASYDSVEALYKSHYSTDSLGASVITFLYDIHTVLNQNGANGYNKLLTTEYVDYLTTKFGVAANNRYMQKTHPQYSLLAIDPVIDSLLSPFIDRPEDITNEAYNKLKAKNGQGILDHLQELHDSATNSSDPSILVMSPPKNP